MGTDWKIYKPNKKVPLKELENDLERIIKLHSDDEKIINVNCQSIESAKRILKFPNLELDKLGLKYLFKSQKELINLCSDDKNDYKFFWIGNENVHEKLENIKFQFTYNLSFDKIELLVNIPYHNKSESIKQSVNLIRAINENLDLHFRNEEEIEKDISNFIRLNIDNKYYDNEWTLKHSHYTFKASGASKQIFEENQFETFRLTGFRIQFPETFIRLMGMKKYGQNILTSFIDYFSDSKLEMFMLGHRPDLIDNLVKHDPLKTEINLEIKFKESVIETILQNNHLFFSGKRTEFRCKAMKFDPTDEDCFSINLYGENIDELEFDLEISKNASEFYIIKVLSLFSKELNYKYEE